MNKILIVDASESDRRLMSGLLTRAGYDPIAVDTMEAAKEEVAKLPPGAVVVTAMKFAHGTAQELVNWQKREGYQFPVIAIVDNLNPLEIADVMKDGGAVDIIQRPAIDKQLIETVGRYAKPESIVIQLDNALIPRRSAKFKEIEQSIERIAQTNANCIIFGESGMGKEQIARQIYLQSSRTQKPITVIEAGGAELVGQHDPTSDRNEMYNRIKSYFQNAAGGTIILKNIQLLNFEKQSVFLHILSEEHPDVRMICTANATLMKMLAEEDFRDNLFLYVAPVGYHSAAIARDDRGHSGYSRLSSYHVRTEDIPDEETIGRIGNQGSETLSVARQHPRVERYCSHGCLSCQWRYHLGRRSRFQRHSA